MFYPYMAISAGLTIKTRVDFHLFIMKVMLLPGKNRSFFTDFIGKLTC
jgi:hypothetical protein